jgi:hypothetical protein
MDGPAWSPVQLALTNSRSLSWPPPAWHDLTQFALCVVNRDDPRKNLPARVLCLSLLGSCDSDPTGALIRPDLLPIIAALIDCRDDCLVVTCHTVMLFVPL